MKPLVLFLCLIGAAFGQPTIITIPEGAQVAVVRVSTNGVTNGVVVAPPKPPTPVSTIGKQHPYISLSTAQFTQTITTVYSVKFMRLIEGTMSTNGLIYTETNFVSIRTNTVSVSTNTTLANPE